MLNVATRRENDRRREAAKRGRHGSSEARDHASRSRGTVEAR